LTQKTRHSYVIVDVGGNRVTFRALNIRIKIKKKKTPRIVSLGRLCVDEKHFENGVFRNDDVTTIM